jgi:hypothetical protein
MKRKQRAIGIPVSMSKTKLPRMKAKYRTFCVSYPTNSTRSGLSRTALSMRPRGVRVKANIRAVQTKV